MTTFPHRQNLLGLFAQHRVAANLTMIIMLLAGVWALNHLNTQFYPNYSFERVNVRVIWRGASAEDIEDGITNRLEETLRTQPGLRELTSTSSEGIASITLEFEPGQDMSRALDQIKEKVALIRDLPADIEQPEITRRTAYERVARVLIWSEHDAHALPQLVQKFERQLLDRGIAQIELIGLQQQEIAIELSIENMRAHALSLNQLGQRVSAYSLETPAGNINRQHLSQQLRSSGKLKTVEEFSNIPLSANNKTIMLGDIADIQRRPRDKQVSVSYRGFPAIEMRLSRLEGKDSLVSAEILENWLQQTLPDLPPGVGIQLYDQRWKFIQQRIDLLLENGITGLILVVGILFLFLRGPVAFWVAVGIPVSFMATLAVLYLLGGSINMVSLFALIMALGIIVDDAIVVGEDAMTHYQSGEPPLSAAEGGASRMLTPVMSSSLTTVAAFVPLMMLGGFIGKLLFTIPLVIVCVIIASLIESFLVLPGHLRHAFTRMQRSKQVSSLRVKIDDWFDNFKNHHFRRWLETSLAHPWQTIAIALIFCIITLGLLLGGRIPFTFFPATESSLVYVNAQFTAGSSRHEANTFVAHLESEIDSMAGKYPGLILLYSSRLGQNLTRHRNSAQKGDRYASTLIELSPSDERAMRNPDFIRELRSKLNVPANMENLSIASRRSGPAGRDVTFRLSGESARQLKLAAEALQNQLQTLAAVLSVEDDLPYGQSQLIFKLNPQGTALGLTSKDIGQQLRAAYDGHLVQIFQDGYDEIEVRTVLKQQQRNGLANLELLPILLPSGEQAPLGSLATFKRQRGFEILRHQDGYLSTEVSADIDESLANANDIAKSLEQAFLPNLAARFNIQYEEIGQATNRKETFSDMQVGSLYALAFIYLILAWVFSSYGWPLVIMAIIPFAIAGAILGHWITGINLTVLSLFGLFGLAGIVVNDSIILVTFYKNLRAEGVAREAALVEASIMRVRAVLLTSLTTIAGLTPLLFETSLQAQFLIPMATSIAFGLGFSTLLVLFMVPLLLNLYESRFDKISPNQQDTEGSALPP